MTPAARSADWSQCLDRHGAVLLLLARQIAPTAADAEDAVQEAFLRYWRSREAAKDPVAYLFACTRTCALEFRRKEFRRSRREEAGARSEVMPDLFTASPEEEERRVAIEARLRALPEEQREAVVLKVWGGLSFEQIGEALSISPNTAASRYRYALEKLRRELAREKVT
jgi:RNA polymerase sigma-70 factor (ECF subfamily)